MKVTVEALPWLGEMFGGKKTTRHVFDVEVEEGATLAAFLRMLAQQHPRFRRVMYDPQTGSPSEQVAVVLNNRLPELLHGYETVLSSGDRIILVQAYAGGAPVTALATGSQGG